MCGAFILRACTHVYTHGLMSSVVFAFAHMGHTHVPFKLWAICTIVNHSLVKFCGLTMPMKAVGVCIIQNTE